MRTYLIIALLAVLVPTAYTKGHGEKHHDEDKYDKHDKHDTCSATDKTCKGNKWCKATTVGMTTTYACVPRCATDTPTPASGECPAADPAKHQFGTAVCKHHHCTYSSCKTMPDSCPDKHWCKTTDGISSCVKGCKDATKDCRTGWKCNASHQCEIQLGASCTRHDDCGTYNYCAADHKCATGCDKKLSACKVSPSTTDNGYCNASHVCTLFTPLGLGAPCSTKNAATCGMGFKCVADHGHNGRCHPVASTAGAACDQKTALFPTVCGAGFKCKKGACVASKDKGKHEGEGKDHYKGDEHESDHESDHEEEHEDKHYKGKGKRGRD